MAPPLRWLKCNTDGASKGNPGPSATTFCLRNHVGDFVGAKGFQIADTTNLVAEARAIREVLQFCLDNQLTNIILETDSLAMVNIINGDWEIPWTVSMEVKTINRIRDAISVRVQHSLREGNTLTDFFANLVFSFAGTYEFSSVQEVPNVGKNIINLDKINTPIMRIRKTNLSSNFG